MYISISLVDKSIRRCNHPGFVSMMSIFIWCHRWDRKRKHHKSFERLSEDVKVLGCFINTPPPIWRANWKVHSQPCRCARSAHSLCSIAFCSTGQTRRSPINTVMMTSDISTEPPHQFPVCSSHLCYPEVMVLWTHPLPVHSGSCISLYHVLTARWPFCSGACCKSVWTQTSCFTEREQEKIHCRVAAPALLMQRVAIDLLYTAWANPLETPSVRSYRNVRSLDV